MLRFKHVSGPVKPQGKVYGLLYKAFCNAVSCGLGVFCLELQDSRHCLRFIVSSDLDGLTVEAVILQSMLSALVRAAAEKPSMVC